jgi:hypothetical protein
MAEDYQQEMLRKYIERLTALRGEEGRHIELADMKEVARELGMSEDDIAAADLAAKAHRDRGLRHLQHRRWDDAVTELREAMALDPMSIEILHPLATAHKERWRATGSQSDRKRASELASRTIAIDPAHDASYLLLNELDEPRRPKAAETSPATPRRRPSSVRWLLVALPLIAITLIGLKIIAARPHPSVEQSEIPQPAVMTVEEGGSELPVIWEGRREDGVNIAFASAGDGSSRITITNVGTRVVRSLRIRVDGGSIEAIAEGDAPLGVGESRVVETGNRVVDGSMIAVELVEAE